MFPSAPFFTPPSSKANAQRKACICNWGDECSEFKTFFDNNGSELGKLVSVRYSNSCDFHNFYHGAISFLRIPKHSQVDLKERYERYLKDPKNDPCPRIKIAKFHFPEIFSHSRKWTAPLSMEEVQKSGVYINRSYQDKLVLYDKDLGSGKKKNNDEKLYRIVPCATRLEVQTIATAVTSIRNRSSVVSKITKYRQKQASEKISTKLQMESKTEQDRTPYEWKKL